MNDFCDIAIIGAGPSGLTAGIYGARAGFKVFLFEKRFPGGQVTSTDLIENYPGFPEPVNGFELADRMRLQAEKFGVKTVNSEVLSVNNDGDFKIITTNDNKYKAKSVIIATGVRYKSLNIPGEKEFFGRGVSTCATCDGALYRDKNIVVVGGGDTAVQETLFLARFASKVTIVHRRGSLRATKILQERVFGLKDKVEIIWESVLDEISGDSSITGVVIRNLKTGEKHFHECAGVFVFIGFLPNIEFIRDSIKSTKNGYIIVDNNLSTSMPGIFACGDVCEKELKQVVTACADGAIASNSARIYIEEKEGTLYV